MTENDDSQPGRSPLTPALFAWASDVRPSDDLNAHLGMMVERLRLRRQMSQHELATAIEATPDDILAYESGAERIPPERLLKIAAVLQAPLSSFFADLE